MKFYSEHGEDKWIYNNLEIRGKGFYVDVGASHPTECSNTAFFDFIGWEGICIEPDIRLKKEWESSRRKAKLRWEAAGNKVNESFLYLRERQGFTSLMSNKQLMKSDTLSSNKKLRRTHRYLDKIKVKINTLDNVVKEHGVSQIDILSIDTEGTELEVTDGLTLIYPHIIIAEYRASGIKEEPQKYMAYFHKRGYELLYDSGLNHIYGLRK